MSRHVPTERLHDLLDGLLDASAAADVRAHLDGCARCRAEHEELGDVVAALRGLTDRATPPDTAWNGIAERIRDRSPGDPAVEPRVLPFPGARAPTGRRMLSMPQAAAAAVLVSLLSAGTVYLAMSGGGLEPVVPAASATSDRVPAASLAATGLDEYDEAVARLEDVLEEGRDVLSPETLVTLEGSLATIEQALEDVRASLAQDPSSEILMGMLVGHQRAKLRILRQAAISVQAAS